jgi:hypothetical protein
MSLFFLKKNYGVSNLDNLLKIYEHYIFDISYFLNHQYISLNHC